MKKLLVSGFLAIAMAAMSIGVIGCKTTDPKDIYSLSFGVGVAAGTAMRMKGMDTNTVEIIITVAPELKKVVPSTNETWQVAWTQAGKDIAEELVKQGKIDEMAAKLVVSCSGTGGLAMDYLFSRHPEWKNSQECINAAVSGAVDGIVLSIKPTSNFAATGMCDQEALLYFLSAEDVK